MATDSGKDSPPLSTESSTWTGSAVQDFNSLAHRIAHKLHLDHPDQDTRMTPPPRTPTSATTPSMQEDTSRPRAVSLGSMPMPEIVMPLPDKLIDGSDSGSSGSGSGTAPLPVSSTTPKKPSQLSSSPPTNAADAVKKPAIPQGYTFQMKPQVAQQKQMPKGSDRDKPPMPHTFEFAKVDKHEDEMLSLDDEGASDFSSWQVPRIFSLGSGH